tara:strand:+ start:1142 stop:3091 length:1950 start_codon:yes stop_codon:yes gene_type:complete
MKKNHLKNEESFYLQQHSSNPINWFPWGKKATEIAKKEKKIIILSIGYSSCHWCHVMEKESFQNEIIAKLMNKDFVSIKVDREERPDIDNIYMDAIQYMGIQGGWPLNVFLLPNLKPFYGGTYFNPNQWYGILNSISDAYSKNKEEFLKSSEKFTEDLRKSNKERYGSSNEYSIKSLVYELKSKFDYEYGGIEKVQKFPMSNMWNSLLYYSISNNELEIYEHIINTLDNIIEGGIYDQIQGGFFRYSTDMKWFVPHFEKMIYDNGLILELLSNIYSITKDEKYRLIIQDTIEWVVSKMSNDNGGFYSSIDADSEGKEGKFYIWKYEELKKILNNDQFLYAKKVFKISKEEEFEGHIILQRNLKEIDNIELFNSIKEKLFNVRKLRIHPVVDEKIILSWNAILLKGIICCYQSCGDKKYLDIALKNAEFLIKNFLDKKNIKRVYQSKVDAFIDDYALTISAFIKLYEATKIKRYLDIARNLTEDSIKLFYNKKEKLFNFNGKKNEKLIANKIEIFDSVIPSSNSVMFNNLLLMGKYYDDKLYQNIYNDMSLQLKKFLNNYEYLSNWIYTNQINQIGINEIQMECIQKDVNNITKKINSWYAPNKIFSIVSTENLKSNKKPSFMICRNYVCDKPLNNLKSLKNKIIQELNS